MVDCDSFAVVASKESIVKVVEKSVFGGDPRLTTLEVVKRICGSPSLDWPEEVASAGDLTSAGETTSKEEEDDDPR